MAIGAEDNHPRRRVSALDTEICPDPASQSIAEGWRIGVVKGLERQFAVFAPESAASVG